MKRTRHQLAPAMPVQQVIDRAVACRMPDRFLVGRLEIVDVQHLAGAGRFGKTREQGFLFGQRHVLVLASAIRLRLERFDAVVVIGDATRICGASYGQTASPGELSFATLTLRAAPVRRIGTKVRALISESERYQHPEINHLPNK